jgi:hypothetical protein
MNIAAIDRLNDCADLVYQSGVNCALIDFPDASALATASRALRGMVRDRGLPIVWEDLCKNLDKYLFRICRSICSPKFVFDVMKADLEQAFRLAGAQRNNVSPDTRTEFEASVAAISALKNISVSPLLAKVLEILESSIARGHKEVVLVIRDNALRQETMNLLSSHQSRIRIFLERPVELRERTAVDRLILLEPFWFLEFKNEEFLIRSPVADEIEVVTVTHETSTTRPSIRLSELTTGERFAVNRTSTWVAGDRETSKDMREIRDEDFVVASDSREMDEPSGASVRMVKACRCILGGDQGVHLAADGDVYVPRCRRTDEALVCREVEKMPVSDLEPGSLVVLTTEGSGDLIERYADEILGEKAQPYRHLQKLWKTPLRRLLEERGIDHLMELFGKQGLDHVEVINVRNWCDGRNIAPDDLDHNFRAILAIVGRADKIKAHLKAIQAIRFAHQSAGTQLHGKLRDAFRGMDLRRVHENGFMEIRPEAGGPAKTVFLVEQISARVHDVPSHAINRVVRLRREELAI